MKKAIVIFLLSFLLAGNTSLAAAEVVKEIQVTGLQRITLARLLSSITLRQGNEFTQQEISQAIKDIFASGFFDDVQITENQGIINIAVDELPAIESIEIKGSKLIKEEQVLMVLEENGIKQSEIFKHNQFEIILNELEGLYAQQGRYGTKVEAETEELDGNRVNIKINIREGKPAKIVQINIVGNKVYKNKQLRDMLNLRERGKWNSASGRVKYSRPKLAADLDILQNYYLNNGYAKVNIKDSVVSINPDKDLIAIHIHIDEGKKYTLDKIDIVGETIVNPQQLYSQLIIKNQQFFSQQRITASSDVIVAILGREGYGLANVNTIYNYNDDEGTIDVSFFVRPGQKTYIRKINFVGNTKSVHTALRRYLVQYEGAPYSSTKISQSLARVRRLSYVEDIQVTRQAVLGEPDKVDLLFTLKEAPSGNVGGGLLYSDLSGVSLSFDYSDRNFYGTGDSFSSSLSYGRVQRALSFNYNQPFITLDGVSANYLLRFRTVDFNEADIGNYAIQSSLFGTTFGYPVSLTNRINYGFRITNINLGVGNNPDEEIALYTERYGKNYNDFSLTNVFSHNSLNRGFKPTAGHRFSLSNSLTFPNKGERPGYYETSLQHSTYFKLSRSIDELAIMLGLKLAYFNTWEDGDAYLPFYNSYYAGGVASVRGYGSNSLGPRATLNDSTDASLLSQGGNIRTLGRFEFIFPVGSLSNDVSGLRTSLFWDIGNVFHDKCIVEAPHCQIPIAYDQLRQAYGLSVRWYIQFFPLTFVFSRPINPKKGDDTMSFQFTLGAEF